LVTLISPAEVYARHTERLSGDSISWTHDYDHCQFIQPVKMKGRKIKEMLAVAERCGELAHVTTDRAVTASRRQLNNNAG